MFYCGAANLNVGVTFNRLQILGCELHKNAFGGPDLLGSYSAPPDSLAVIRGRGREGWKEEMGRGRSVRREGADGERR